MYTQIPISDKDIRERVIADIPKKYRLVSQQELESLTTIVTEEGCDLSNLDFLKYCKNLTEIYFHFCDYSPHLKPLKSLPYLPSLKKLSLEITGITNLHFLANCPNLESLSILEGSSLNISPLNKLSKLKYLCLDGIDMHGTEYLKTLSSVKVLELNQMDITNFPFQKFPNLEKFTCQDVNVTDLPSLMKSL